MGAATTSTTTTLQQAATASCASASASAAALPGKHIVDADPSDTDNNNANCVANHNTSIVLTDGKPTKPPATANGVANGSAVGGSGGAPQTEEVAAAAAAATAEQEFSFFGIKFGAKLKWVNIIGITIIHALFVYIFTHNPLMPRYQTYLWGEFIFCGLSTAVLLLCVLIRGERF